MKDTEEGFSLKKKKKREPVGGNNDADKRIKEGADANFYGDNSARLR